MRRWILTPRAFLFLLTALFYGLSFQPSPLWFLAYFFIPFYLALHRNLTFKQGFKTGYFFGMLISFLLLYWVALVTVTGVILLILVHSLYYALLGGASSAAMRRYGNAGLILFPFIWVAVEYFRSLSQISFPWLNLSYTQAENLPIVQLAELSGDGVITFFVVLIGTLLYLGYRQSRHPLRAGAIFLVAILLYSGAYIWGASRFVPLTPDYKVSALQGNIPIELKWKEGNVDANIRNYEQLTEAAAADSAKLVVWPETAVPAYLLYEPAYLAWLKLIAERSNVDLLTGSLHLEKERGGKNHYYNSAFYFTSQGLDQRIYKKVNLLPFSEHIPYEEGFGFVDDFKAFVSKHLGLDVSDFEPGDSIFLYETGGRRFGVLICFEVVFPEFVREVVDQGADFLTVITNDAWFGRTAGPHQHAAISIFRAVENRCWLVRSANTGISEIIDPFGRTVAKSRLNERLQLSGYVGPRLGSTLFRQRGLLFSKISLAVTVIGVLIIMIRKKNDD